MAPFLIDAAKLTIFQSCKRKFLLNTKWYPLRWNPKALFDSCLRQAIGEFGSDKDVKDIVDGAVSRYMNTGANSGLDVVGKDPYVIALDYCSLLSTIIPALYKRTQLRLMPIPSVKIREDIEWVFLAYQDQYGELHRFITVDHWDEDRLASELHGWYVFGDICAARKPMHLHIIEIGQMRDNRRQSPWARAWEHEYIKGRIKFQRKGGKALQGTWNPVYLCDTDQYKPSEWLELMENEGVVDTLIHQAEVLVPDNSQIKKFKQDITIEARQMIEWSASVNDPIKVPMSRAACDSPFPCQYQAVCFAPLEIINIESIGGYKPKI